MATIKKFEDFICWQEARALNRFMRNLIKEKRFDYNFRLINQIEGSAGSIMDNIAEGFDRGGNKEFILFLSYAKGSCAELKSQAYRAMDSGYISEEEFKQIFTSCDRIGIMIYRLIKFLKNSEIKGLKFKNEEST
jgi:four helix bundle protein